MSATLLDCDIYASRLSDAKLEARLKLSIAVDLRDSVEVFQNAEYPRFLQVMMPVFRKILNETPPVFVNNDWTQKLRNVILEILHRLPLNEALKQYALDLLKLVMQLLRTENEENAVICLKIIIDLHKHYKAILEDQVQPFLNIVQEMYRNMEQTVRETFDTPTPYNVPQHVPQSPRPTSPAYDNTSESTPVKTLAKSLYSFKVLTECPIIVVLLFQSHRQFVNTNIKNIVPLIIQTLGLQATPQAEAHAAARAANDIFVGVASGIRDRAKYTEFIVAQVKTMSFLAYVLRAYTTALKTYQDKIPDFVIRLLQDCPPEASATRKELLVATRHILSTEFRSAFVSKIDLLLKEKVLVGTGITSYETIRPLAYSMLADLVHHVRNELTVEQLHQTIYIYSLNLHDPTLNPTVQTMCSKLLLHMIECSINISDVTQKRDLLMKIFDTFCRKFYALNYIFPDLIRQLQKRKNPNIPPGQKWEESDFEQSRPIATSVPNADQIPDPLNERRSLLKNLVHGLRSIISGLKSCNPEPPQNENPQTWSSVVRGFSHDEVVNFLVLFRQGIRAFDLYTIDNDGNSTIKAPEKNAISDASNNKLGPQSKAEKEVLDGFANIFVNIDPAIFQEIFGSQMNYFFEQTLRNTSLLQIPQLLLGTEGTSENFAGILFRFLVDRLDRLGGPDPVYASVLLRLFKLAFMAVTLFPNVNEMVLHPHLAKIIMSSMKLSTKAKEPKNYFLLLRALFRSIAGGRFEMLYKEVLPLLQVLLEGLNSLLSLTHKPQMRDLFVELCLTVPVRLSVLLPYLSYLMKPLVLALQAGPELVTQGLRTLELCIDNLTPEFLDPLMAPVINDLMLALWKHLKPSPYNPSHSISATRILGKLGGRNRRLLKDPPKLSFTTPPGNGLDLQIFFDSNSAPQKLPLDECLTLTAKTLEDPNVTLHYKKQAFKFLVSSIPLLFDLDPGSYDLTKLIATRVQRRLLHNDDNESATIVKMEIDNQNEPIPVQTTIAVDLPPSKKRQEGHKLSLRRKAVQEERIQLFLCALFTAASLPDLKDEAWPCLENVCRHIALLEVGDAVNRNIREKKFTFDENSSTFYLETKVMVEALVTIMASDEPEIRKVAEFSLKLIYDICLMITGSKDALGLFPLFHVLASRFCSCCYKQEWYRKSGGCFGISLLCSQLDMGAKWMLDHELEFVRSLFFIMKDTSSEFATGNIADATQTVLRVIEVCSRPNAKGEIREKDNKFNKLVLLLVAELSNSNNAVRECAQSAFKLLAELTACEITDILTPVRDALLNPIFGKPLKALPPPMQIGYIDAITYALTLRPSLLEYSEELNRLLNESLQLADSEEQVAAARPTNYKNAASVTNLRVVCIKFLTAAMACPDFLTPRQGPIRARIIGVFFKSLYSRVPEIVEVSNKGLASVLHQQKLQKDLLQAGLRPILVNLSDHKKLTVAGLEGLARLLELLTNYFKVEIGRKLLDHLTPWADPKTLQDASNKPLMEIEAIKIIVSILAVFHLLPPAANVFMDNLITTVLDLEEKLRRSSESPFRLPLIKFLNRYAGEAVDYFYNHIEDQKYINFFVDLLGIEESTKLREEIMDNPQKLLEKTVHLGNSQAHFKRILIIRKIANYNPEWLVQEDIIKEIREAWHEVWNANQNHRTDEMSINVAELQEYQNIIETGLAYMRANPDDVSLMFEFVAIFTRKSVIDYHLLRQFYYEEVAMGYPAERKRAVIEKFVKLFDDPLKNNARIKTAAARMIINPLLMYAFAQGPQEYNKIIDIPMIDKMHKNIWQTQGLGPEDIDDPLRIELFQMTTLLVQYVPHLIEHVKRDLILFGWKSLNLDDVTTKQAAYVLCARFIAAFEFPVKLIHNAYMSLLRAHQLEARTLVKQALDIFTPVLPRRMEEAEKQAHTNQQLSIQASQSSQRSQHIHLPPSRAKPAVEQTQKIQPQSYPSWTTWTKKVLSEDTYSISQLVNVYQLLVRHPDLFYENRQQFLPQIINTLTRLGLIQNATNETRLLTIDLSELILRWEKRRISELRKRQEASATSTPAASVSSPGKRRMDLEAESPPKKRQQIEHSGELRLTPVEISSSETYTPNLILRENVIGYLVRFVCTTNEAISKSPGGLPYRALQLIKEFLQPEFWPEVNVKLLFFERTLMHTDITNNTLDNICNGLDVLNVILDRKPAEWCLANISHLQRLLEKSIRSNHNRLQQSLNPVLVHIFNSFPSSELSSSEDTDIANFTSVVHATIEEGLNSMDNLYAVLTLLNALKSKNPENIDNFLPGVLNVLTKLAKDHLIKILIMALQIMNSRIAQLIEHRSAFIQVLCQLLDKTKDTDLARSIFEMVKFWVMNNKRDLIPTMKEKAKILNKMLSFESIGDKNLLEDYLNLVINIYSDPGFVRTDLTVKLEQAFLLGTRYENPQIRNRFMKLLDQSISNRLNNRLRYIIEIQNWESVGSYFWLHQAVDILLGAISRNKPILPPAYGLRTKSLSNLFNNCVDDSSSDSFIVTTELEDCLQKHRQFLTENSKSTVADLLIPLKQIHHLSDQVAYRFWVDLFPVCWSSISQKDRQRLHKNFIAFLSKEYHNLQAEFRPNCIQAILEGIARCSHQIKLPPYLIMYLGKTHGAWHIALEILQQYTLNTQKDDDEFKEKTLDALADLYSSLSEDDMAAGLWRRRSIRLETNTALSHEQCGMWVDAQLVYENAQLKGRSAVMSFTEPEYLLWEDHWLDCSQKLQQWEVLTDFAKNEGNTELLLECAWRLSDWTEERDFLDQAINSLSDKPTPRNKVFEAFMSLVKAQQTNDFSEFKKIAEESLQLSLRRWHSLPEIVSQCHIPILQIFQQFVELEEATKMCTGLNNLEGTPSADSKSQELKSVLQSWRERLPNSWDDINIWSDLVAWRRHIFRMINNAFQPFQRLPPGNAISNINFAFRGHHETAWIINRFAHVARKHHLSEVCVTFLQHIYSLPNIEIQEAFLKLREQAKCHYQNSGELTNALDVINNTNLNYFGPQQKAEFHTLKGMVMAKMGRDHDADASFAMAVQVEMRLPKAWAEWGRYYDRKFKDDSSNILLAANALSCYLQAAGLYNNHKSRKLLVRILWLLSLDDTPEGHISRVFESYMTKGEVPTWYWVTFIPQLIVGLVHKEARYARNILTKIAKQHPQALYFQLRTAREDYMFIKKQAIAAAQARAAQQASLSVPGTPVTPSTATPSTPTAPNEGYLLPQTPQMANGIIANGAAQRLATPNQGQGSPAQPTQNQLSPGQRPSYVGMSQQSPMTPQQPQSPAIQPSNGINAANLGGSPSNNLTMQNIQALNGLPNAMSPNLQGTPPSNITNHMSPSTPNGADSNRSPITPLGINNSNMSNQNTPPIVTQHLQKQPWEHVDDIMSILKTTFPLLSLSIETMVDQIQIRLKPTSDEDIYRLIVALLNDGVQQINARLNSPHDDGLLNRPTEANIRRFAENLYQGPIKAAFEEDFIQSKPNLYQYVEKLRKWRDRFEILLDSKPRKQHLEHFSAYLHRDCQTTEFIRIDRFLPEIDIIRSHGFCYRRLTIRGHDGSLHSFAVQQPAARHSRREERIMQFFRMLNSVLERRIETRKRNLYFHLPIIVPLAPQIRLVQDDPSYSSLQDIFEDHCDTTGMSKDDPVIYYTNKMRSNLGSIRGRNGLTNLRVEIADEIAAKMIPNDVITKYMSKSMKSHIDLWTFRKHFTTQMAGIAFMSYILCIGQRHPYKMIISKNTGNVWATELLPTFSSNAPFFLNGESVPFRFTRGIQHFMTPIGIEGVFIGSLMSIAQCLTEPEFDLEQHLSVLVRDELLTWHYVSKKPVTEPQLRQKVAQNVESIVKRAETLACKEERDKRMPVFQPLLEIIANASNPQNLAYMDVTWMQWL
ncbi:1279_t:CDS:10 [Ambispora gerdemannii]|uniref:1279_t:CDS:1 n=1 Tax=Ambispora gerdemannii TaxID=144530 RepID=A0A9N8WN03_9GLOM|nr:1279_t:CDS:10 [Ambispora gerdemannii]